ncbi:hypothetical protein [Palleronia caenipelagi]|uniref:Transcriptional regulator n=1 Tax=Palleronia caenipelagi TaxID=2489174 RepID=A0A547PLA3_9RHOB|nr:hypothetical protein [Palleronia caenipelagi]TRD14804.1 hypothetical protein FEV53_18310 [Palleronia caenipelagi]
MFDNLRRRPGPKDAALRRARVCYNHLAGDMGTRMFARLMTRGQLVLNGDALTLTGAGDSFARECGIDVEQLRHDRAPLCRECLDWNDRRSQLAGSLGPAFLSRFEELDWAKRDPKTRIVAFSRAGERAFDEVFPVD